VILSFHFHLGVLILVDTLDAQPETQDLDTSCDITAYRLSSTRAIVNLINLMLLQAEPYTSQNTTSIILKDPYPEHTRNGLSRAAYSVLHLSSTRSLPNQVAEIMASSLFAGLEILTQISYTAAESLGKLQKVYAEANLFVKRRQAVPSACLTATASSLDSQVTPQIFEKETVRQLGLAVEDPSLVDKSIERHETPNVPEDFEWYDLPGIDVSFVTQDWVFDVCSPNTTLNLKWLTVK
jgi:hypothetical protein